MSTDRIEQRLDVIRKGQLAMVQVAQDRLAAAIAALLDGDFANAYERCAEAVAKLDSLNHTQGAFTRLADGALFVLAPDLQKGMTIIGWGVLSEPPELIGGERGGGGVKLKWVAPDGAEVERVIPPTSELCVFPEGAGE